MKLEINADEDNEEAETYNQHDAKMVLAIQLVELLDISLRTIIGAPSSKTMRFAGNIN